MPRLRPGHRAAAVLAILLLLGVAGSDSVVAGFWVSHPMLTAIVSALAVVVLSVTVDEPVLLPKLDGPSSRLAPLTSAGDATDQESRSTARRPDVV